MLSHPPQLHAEIPEKARVESAECVKLLIQHGADTSLLSGGYPYAMYILGWANTVRAKLSTQFTQADFARQQ